MAAGRLLIPGWMPALDEDGNPIPNARVFFYLNKTTTLAAVFSDEAMTVPLVNPVPSNASGRFPAIWADDSVLYSASVDAPYGPAGIPFTYDNLSASMAADILVAGAAEAAADEAQQTLLDIQAAIDAAMQTGGGDAAVAGAIAGQAAASAVVATKADNDAGNLTQPNARDFRFRLGFNTSIPQDFVGGVQEAVSNAGPSGTVYLPDGDYPVSSFDNGGGANLIGPGRVMLTVPGGAAQQVNTYADAGHYLYGAQYLYRWFARMDPATGGGIVQPLNLTAHGDSTIARGATNITGSISGTTLTVTNSNGATIVVGTYLSGVQPGTRVTGYGTGTGENGTYTVNISQSFASGTIEASNGGGFAGVEGELQNLLPSLFRATGLQKPVRIKNYAIGGSNTSDIDVASHIPTDSSGDGCIIATFINDEGLGGDIDASLALLSANLDSKLSAIRSNPYGAYSQYGILVVGPSPFYYPAGMKSTEWLERCRNIILEKCRKYKAAFFDRYAMFQDVRDTGGFALDSIQVHPLRTFQFLTWSKVADEILPRALAGRFHDGSIASLSLSGGWLSLGAPFMTGVRLFEDGTAQVYVAINGGTTTAGTVWATLPTWARPPFTIPFALCTSTSGTVVGRIDPNGVCDFGTTADATYTFGISPRFPVTPLT